MRFTYDAILFSEEETSTSLEMEENDVIEVRVFFSLWKYMCPHGGYISALVVDVYINEGTSLTGKR